MAVNSPAAFPALPPSVAEWEDLLIRMEIMQRVLRNTLESVPRDDRQAARVLEELLRRETQVGKWLEVVSAGPERFDLKPGQGPAQQPSSADLQTLADCFVSVRARNFAMLQRRGLEVWRWTGEYAGYGQVSAFQVITWLVAEDVRCLAALRERTAAAADACSS